MFESHVPALADNDGPISGLWGFLQDLSTHSFVSVVVDVRDWFSFDLLSRDVTRIAGPLPQFGLQHPPETQPRYQRGIGVAQ